MIHRDSILLLIGLLSMRPSAAEPLNLTEAAAGVFVHQGVHELPDSKNHGEIANIGFIVGERCVAVIDSGGSPAQGRALRSAITAKTPIPVCYVINTHVHPDHIYGNKAFKAAGIAFIGHWKLAQAMASRAPYYMEKASRDLENGLQREDFIPPDLPVETTRELDLGGRKLTLTAHGPAHTDSDLSVYDDKTQTLWLADLLFMDHIPVIDGSLNGWLKELRSLTKIKANRAIPGHGPMTGEWPKAAEAEIHYLEMLRNDIRAYLKQGKTMEQAMAELGQPARAQWRLFDEFHKRNISTAFAELEWED
ncbi:MAG: quinoprotein relay system zinc metallohydrolase 2 [Methylococcaceae bacterium]|nr:quinoprotein relay system zinc metallohydrolase 2 [Methylococcaceae bacterium]